MSKAARILVALGALALLSTLFLPFWEIYLIAPQYPEGLAMQIWLSKLTGQVEIINGLNHYIGMKHIREDMFPEFKFLEGIMIGFVILGIAVAVIGKRKWLLAYLLLLGAGGALALFDFYQWGYDYGHNLDPNAAIRVPGLTYQPPLIGHKQLLNFDAYSYPHTGGWIVVGAAALLILVYIMEGRRNRPKLPMHNKQKAMATGLVGLLVLAGCTPEPEPIVAGKDSCYECKMTIADPKFGGEILTKKGRVYKFDDVHCMALFLKNRSIELPTIHSTLFVDYTRPGQFVEVHQAEFLLSSSLKSPMGGNAAAFPNTAAAKKASEQFEGSRLTNWPTLYNILIK